MLGGCSAATAQAQKEARKGRKKVLEQVVKVGADPDRGLIYLVQVQFRRYRQSVRGNPLAVAMGIAIG